MIPKFEPPANPGKPKKRKPYWSVMLVGEHGRVIPFKYFKELAIGVIALMILVTAAGLLAGYLYFRQTRLVGQLQAEIADVREQGAKLRDEKDMLLTQLVISQKPALPESAPEPAGAAVPASPQDKAPTDIQEKSSTAAASSDETKRSPSPSTAMMGKISQFGVAYDSVQTLLTIKFRLHNATPGKPLSGRAAVVLSSRNDAAVKQVVIPGTALADGETIPKQGQAFTVNNYRTMEFKLPNPPTPIVFDIANVFVFTTEGAEILQQKFAFEIEQKPTPGPAEKVDSAPLPIRRSVDKPARVTPGPGPASPSLEKSIPQETVSTPPAADNLPVVDSGSFGSTSDDVREKY